MRSPKWLQGRAEPNGRALSLRLNRHAAYASAFTAASYPTRLVSATERAKERAR